MAVQRSTEMHGGWVQYRRFSELIFMSVGGHLVFASFYGLYLGQTAIGLALAAPSLLILALFPLSKTRIPQQPLRLVTHGAALIDFAGLNLALIWMGLPAHSSAWWCALWPMFVAHLVGVVDGLIWLLIGCGGVLFIWANEQNGWIAPLLRSEDNPVELMQLGFVMIVLAFGLIVRSAFDRYNRAIEQKQRTIDEQNRALAERNQKLEDMLQAVQEANLERTRMFASISHEVRTPLNGLMGFMQLLKKTELNAQQRTYLEQVDKCSDTLLQMVNEVLDFSRLEAAPTQLHERPYDPVVVAHEAVDMLESIAQHKGVTLEREFPEMPMQVVGDPLRLKQVILNLLGNALKFTEQGSVRVRCRTDLGAGGQTLLHVEVQDTGIGIPVEAQALLFQPFSPASDETMEKYGGSGLGLAICKRLVDLMEGHIGVSSRPGKGSLFWFEVPVRLAA
ncbi:sensor histidine kinase [Aquabacterium sp.]|uniref:sensor histidine kinase n=1 Tax=Aquabacterium sp. TaxID=1872578 RepID=UPI002E310524|nr:ATP-binding protein [Aquabacterium sp.]HEX5312962.1 ATP-binding protein [Aquabacterium sp.]